MVLNTDGSGARCTWAFDAYTREIRDIEAVTGNSVGDAPMLPPLLAQLSPEELIASVRTDGAYCIKDCHAALQACQRLGREISKIWSGYHLRSLVEAKMHCLKRLGERVMARTFERQVT